MGWKLSEKEIELIWRALAEASQACKELIKCYCRTCMECCRFKQQNLKCTELCGCCGGRD